MLKILPKLEFFLRKHNKSKQQPKQSQDWEKRRDSSLMVSQSSELANFQTVDASMSEQWSPAMQSLLDQPSSQLPMQIISGGIVFLACCLVWAWFGEIDRIGQAQGKLIPEGETYKLEPTESAKVNQILVQEGQKVKVGQLIAKLDPAQHDQEVVRLRKLLQDYEAELAQKINLLKKVVVETNTHQLIAAAEIKSQQSSISAAQTDLEVRKELLAKRKSEFKAYSKRTQRVQNLSTLEQEKLFQTSLELGEHEERLARLKPLVEEGAISQEALFQAKQAQRQAQQQLTNNKLESITHISEQIFQSEKALREMEAQIVENQGRLVSGQQEVERLKAEMSHKKGERQRIELEALQKEEQIKLEINQTKTKIFETKNQLVKATKLLQQRSLKAPVAGTILSLNVANIGKVLQSGETLAEIAPQNSRLVLDARIPDQDAGFVELGMPAKVKFDAYSYQNYGVIPGKVISISSDTKNDEVLGSVYQVQIELERDYITNQLRKVSFKPGQTASADIVIRKQRVIDVLIDPIKKLNKDGIAL